MSAEATSRAGLILLTERDPSFPRDKDGSPTATGRWWFVATSAIAAVRVDNLGETRRPPLSTSTARPSQSWSVRTRRGCSVRWGAPVRLATIERNVRETLEGAE